MATTKDKYFEKISETLVNHNDCHNAPLSNDKLRQAVSKVMEEIEEEVLNAKNNARDVTIDTFCHSYGTTNTQRENTNVTNERQIS